MIWFDLNCTVLLSLCYVWLHHVASWACKDDDDDDDVRENKPDLLKSTVILFFWQLRSQVDEPDSVNRMQGKYPVVDTGVQNFDNIQPDPGCDDTVFELESVAVSDMQPNPRDLYLNAECTICTDNYYTCVPLAVLPGNYYRKKPIWLAHCNRKYLPTDVS